MTRDNHGGSWRGRPFRVAPDHPCLAGHFPGNPIVPAVLILDLVQASALEARPELGSLCGIRSAKFLRAVHPGDEVDISFSAARSPAALIFECSTPAGLVAQGELVFAA